MLKIKNVLILATLALLVSCSQDSQYQELDAIIPTKSSISPELETTNNRSIIQPHPSSCDPVQLANFFAPQLRFHEDEEAYPSSVDWYLQRADLVVDFNRLPGTEILNRDYPNGILDNPHDDLTINDGDLSTAKFYVNIQQSKNNSNDLDIQYWVFYPYNPGFTKANISSHEGDWERITIRLNGSCGVIKKIHYGGHGNEGRWYYPGEFSYVNGSHPIVYSARRSHAHYPTSGNQARYLVPSYLSALINVGLWPSLFYGFASLYDDDETSNGISKNTQGHLEFINIQVEDFPNYPFTTPAWLNFTGRWGEDGPTGPRQKSEWTQELEDFFLFYEGNSMSQETLGILKGYAGFDVEELNLDLQNMGSGWSNDEIRSMRICNGTAGTKIRLFGNPDGNTSEDYTIITILNDIPDKNLEIRSFEQDIDNLYYRLRHYGSGEIDGKISRIIISDEPHESDYNIGSDRTGNDVQSSGSGSGSTLSDGTQELREQRRVIETR